MSIKKVLCVSVMSLLLASCSMINGGSAVLSDKNISDSQINARIIDGTTTVSSLSSIIGKKDETRYALKKSFPEGKLSVAAYKGALNSITGTYAHRILTVAYGTDNIVMNHGVFVKNLAGQNKYNLDYLNSRNLAFSELEKGNDKTKVISLLGNPDGMTFSDNGDMLLVYAKTEVTRDASSYIPVYNMISGTESGVSERLYIELNKNGKIENVTSASVNISQGRGMGNADSYVEKYENIKSKY